MKKILTGLSALYKMNLISFSPAKQHFEMLLGTNPTKYNLSKYIISLQHKNTFTIGVVEIDNEYVYEPERLFIELKKFKMENTIKKEAFDNLEKIISPEKVQKYYQQLNKKRRGIDNQVIEDYLAKHLLDIKKIVTNSEDKKTIIQEYLMALVARKNIPVCLIKGGSSIELFITINRSTLDVDIHTNKESINQLLEYLGLKDDKDIYFKINDSDESNANIKPFFDDHAHKKIIKISLVPISKGGTHKQQLENIVIPISLNTTYSANELKTIVKEYKITKRQLTHISNASVLTFTREMLLAEKFQSLINKPSASTRTKDLIDLKLIWEEGINQTQFKKWLYRKWKNSTNPKIETEAKEIIYKHQFSPLTKIEANFNDALEMYDLKNTTFSDCKKIYDQLIKIALN